MPDIKEIEVDPALKAAKTRMYHLVNSLATKEQVTAALGMQGPESQDEEFWADAFRTVRLRFFLLCIADLQWDLATEWGNLDAGELHVVADQVEERLRTPEFGYTDIRNWFLNRGRFEFSQAIELRRETAELAAHCLRVLVLLEAGGAKYLAYDALCGRPVLVDGPALAHQFPLKSPSQKSKEHLGRMAAHFDGLRHVFAVKQVKVLAGAKEKTRG